MLACARSRDLPGFSGTARPPVNLVRPGTEHGRPAAGRRCEAMPNTMRAPVSRRTFLGSAGAAAAVASFPAIVRAQAREVKVGYILPVTGPLAFEANLALSGLQLAVDEINASGGVKSLGGAKLVLLPGDTQNKV